MRYFFTLLLFFLVVSISSCVTFSVKNDGLPVSHVGRWTGFLKDGSKIYLYLGRNGDAKLILDDKVVIPDDKVDSTIYVIDYNAKPVTLDIVFTRGSLESIVYRMIIEFLSPEMIRAASYFSSMTPTNFNGESVFILKKK
ncbi:MAG TPA: hypothetical protein PLO89_12050 [Spirochaetota bacterium]|nr:hypothetical protein [Spirochaetota bacterium]